MTMLEFEECLETFLATKKQEKREALRRLDAWMWSNPDISSKEDILRIVDWKLQVSLSLSVK